MQSVSVYRFPDRLLVAPNCPTPTGVRLSSEPYTVLPTDTSNRELGAAIEAALSISTRTVPHPKDWKAASAPRLTAAGVTSERAFQQKSTLVQILKSEESIRIAPSHNGGAAGEARGFHPIANAEVVVPPMSQSEGIGAEVRRAFEQCTS